MTLTLPPLRHLPRETRDTLFSLAIVGWTILPHAGNLPPWCVGLAIGVLLWRAQIALRNAALPGRWVVAALLLLACGLTWWSERTLLGKEAGVTMLVVLISLKTLELRARRDAMVMFFLGFFLVLTQFLYSQSLAVALSTLVSVWGLLTALVLAHMPVGRPAFVSAAKVAARAALLGAPVMLVLFLLFPRVGPLWGMPQDASGRTGLSGSLRVGAIADLANDDSIAFRVRFLGLAPSPQQMYFRGPVLVSYNGRDWTREPLPANQRPPLPAVELGGTPLVYEMTIEPSRLPLLPLLELTPQRGNPFDLDDLQVRQRPDLEWVTDRPLTDRVRLQARAWLQHRIGPGSADETLDAALQLPPGVSPRMRQWATELAARPEHRGADAQVLANALLRHVRSGGFSYTLEPGAYVGDVLDEFWFDRKLGFCEHFAAAFVFLMRSMNVPARIVTGYQGADMVPVDGFFIVRQSHAHAWAEYWQAGRGWVRVDPTAAVAPERIRRSANLTPPPGLVAGALRQVDPEIAARLRQTWELMNNRWNQYVLNYARGQQFELLKSLGFSAPSWQDLAYTMFVLLSVAALAGAGWAGWDRWRQDPWLRLQRKVQQRLARLGVEVESHHPPRTRAARVRQSLGAAGEDVARTLDALDAARYAAPTPRVTPRSWWPQFRRATARVPKSAEVPRAARPG